MKYFLIALLALTFACKEGDNDLELKNQTVFFQFEYANEAWVHQHNGFIIDSNGNIYDYELPKNWNWPEEGKISYADFMKNLSKAEKRDTTVNTSELVSMMQKALVAKDGELTKAKWVMADAGAESYAIYLVDDQNTTIERFLLQTRGDLYQKNKSSASDEITNWLIGIRGEPGFSEDPFNE